MKRHTFLFLFVMILLASCEKQNVEEDMNSCELSEYAVKAEVATGYALEFINGSNDLKSVAQRKVKSTKEMSTPFDNKQIYVVEFELGGFVLMSDNFLNIPVLAYSETGTWQYESFSEMAPAAEEWLMDCIRTNMEIESDTTLQRLNNTRAMWNMDNFGLKGATRIDPDECTQEYIDDVDNIYDNTVLTSEWNQGNPFNACFGGSPAGCGPVAMGQLMYYWQYPNPVVSNAASVYWNTIYDSYNPGTVVDCGSSPISLLMSMIRHATNAWTEDNWTLVTVHNLVEGLQEFGYNAVSSDYDFGEVTKNIRWGYPVIIKGGTSLFSQHYWICDGFREMYQEYLETCHNGPVTYTRTYASNYFDFVHLNWGWSDENLNIWYSSGNITRPLNKGDNYYKHMKLIHHIHPN